MVLTANGPARVPRAISFCHERSKSILNHIRKGELVYDPFLGSGTTLAAAEVTERVCCGLELDPQYADVAVERWQGLTGKKATLEGDGRTFESVAQERMRRAA
ncbi:MAG TPA: DNA methyltransferase [Terriglobales bacterium]